jgi:hypothetical protein
MISPLTIGLSLFVIIDSDPYFTAWLISGNPVFPFFNGVFQSIYYEASNFNNAPYNTGITWDFLYKIIFDSKSYLEATNGATGFQWLLLLPTSILLLIIKWNKKAMLLLLTSILCISAAFYSQSYLRYSFPIFILVGASISVSVNSIIKLHPVTYKVLVGLGVITIGLNILFFSSATWTYRSLPLSVLVDKESKRDYLTIRSPVRIAVEEINHINIKQLPVAFLTNETYAAGLNSDALYPTWHNNLFRREIYKITSSEHAIGVLSKYNLDYIILDSNWSDVKHRTAIEMASIEVMKFGYISVRKLISREI